jgi:colanic acid/amylovoran biosynthesis glycosyltransferase
MAQVSPSSPWVLHVNYVLGALTERWIDSQVLGAARYRARLLGRDSAPGAVRQPYWILSRDSLPLWTAHRALGATGGRSGRLLAAQIPNPGPDVVHAHFGPVGWAHRRLANALNAPLVVAFYGADASAAPYATSRRWGRRYEALFADAAAFAVEGPAMAARLEALGCPASKLAVTRLPADEASLEGIAWNPPTDRFRVVAGGRFEEKKGFDTAIRAFATGLGNVAEAELLLIGGGAMESDLRSLAAEYGVRDRVAFSGPKPHAEFMAALAGGHVAIFPSRTAADGAGEGGAPVTLVEARWIGIPTVVSTHDDLPFVAPEESAVQLPPTDAVAWAEALRELHGNRAELKRLARAGRRHARGHHSLARNVEGRERLYDAVRASLG